MSTYQGNGQYDLKRLSIVHRIEGDKQDQELDLSSAYYSINLFESIFDSTMTGYVTVLDTFNLNDTMPLYGNERFELEFATLGNDKNTLAFSGRIYKISEPHRLSEHATGFTIYFCSEELINSHKQHVQTSFNEEVSSVVEKLYGKIKRKEKPKQLSIVPTKHHDKFVFGTINPFDAINILSTYAESKNSEYGYLFYEDNKQFNFVPLEYLYSQDPVIQYTYRQGGAYEDKKNKLNEAFVGIQDIKFLEDNSYLDRAMDGLHGSTSIRLDLYTKDYETYKYTKEDGFKRTKSLGKIPFKKSQESNEAVGDFLTKFKVASDPKVPLESSVKTQYKKAEINETRVEITVFGDSNIRAGQVCFSQLPNWNSNQENNKNMIDGDFLITSINHNLTQIDYTQIMMLQKESYTSA